MNHTTEKFSFTDSKGKSIEVSSLPYTLALEEGVLKKRFGAKWKELLSSGSLELDINIESVAEDFPKLLDLKNAKINWAKQNYDELARVYLFFLEYRLNVKQRALKSEADALRSQISGLQNLLLTLPSDIFQKTIPKTS